MTYRRHRRQVALVIATFALVFAACGAADKTPTMAPTQQPAAVATSAMPTVAPSPDATATSMAQPSVSTQSGATPSAHHDEDEIHLAATHVLDAMQRHDRDRLHELSGHHLDGHDHDRDMDHLATCMPEHATARIVDQRVEIHGDTATSTVTLELTSVDGTKTTVERTWAFAKDTDGVWRLAELPQCPLR